VQKDVGFLERMESLQIASYSLSTYKCENTESLLFTRDLDAKMKWLPHFTKYVSCEYGS
jgi:hypothetical protein